MLNSLKAREGQYDLPWHKISAAMKDIIVFEPNMLDCHRILHLHGSAVYHLFIDYIPRFNLPPEIKNLIENSHCVPLKYRHVWIEVDDYQLSVVERGEQWYDCETVCRLNALSSAPDTSSDPNPLCPRPDNAASQFPLSSAPDDNVGPRLVLSVESICTCYIDNPRHFASKCSCLCHLRICTHYLNDHTPKLTSCLCVAAKTIEIDGISVSRAPWKRLVYTESLFIFFIPESGVWFSSNQRDIRRAYASHLETFTQPR